MENRRSFPDLISRHVWPGVSPKASMVRTPGTSSMSPLKRSMRSAKGSRFSAATWKKKLVKGSSAGA